MAIKAKLAKREPRKIMVQSDFHMEVYELLNGFFSSLADGYWEGEGYHNEVWNCFDVDVNRESDSKKSFYVILKAHPTYREHEEETVKFFTMSDEELVDYLKSALIESIEEYPEAFHYSDYELDVLKQCTKTAKILPPALPKMSHEDLVELVGHDFEYEK